MDGVKFNSLITAQIKRVEETLLVKNGEYANEDNLHNFRTAAVLGQTTMEQALAGMMIKHTVSINDMIASGEKYDISKWEEKITDHMVYLILLRCILEEGLSV